MTRIYQFSKSNRKVNFQNLKESSNNPLMLLRNDDSARSLSSDSSDLAKDSLDAPNMVRQAERIYTEIKNAATLSDQLKQT